MNSNPPRVSIGMPIYNGERYLRPALDSVLAQTFKDFEIIISDNASTDATPEICSAYADKDQRIRYYRNERNIGGGPNHNRTIGLATAKYFKWAHYDDIWAPDLLAESVEILDRYPNVALCYAKTRVIDEHGSFVTDLEDGLKLRAASPVDRYRAFHKRYRREKTSGHIILGLMRMDAFKKTRQHGSFYWADIVLLAELSLLGEFYEIPEPLFYRRRHPESSTIKYTPQGVAVFEDTTNSGRILLPRWRMSYELARSLQSSHLTFYDKLRCFPQIGLWYLRLSRGLALDLLWVVRQFARLGIVKK
ncbi:MAG: glycosyltransferase family 2 protein [Gammaproteobacteria bacterium]